MKSVLGSHRGNVIMTVILWILFLSLAGFTIYMHTSQTETMASVRREIDDQAFDLKRARETASRLDEDLSSAKIRLADQESSLRSLKSESDALKKSLTETQQNLAAMKSDNAKNNEALLSGSSRMQTQLSSLMDEIRKLEKSAPPSATPVIDVNVSAEPVSDAGTKKSKSSEQSLRRMKEAVSQEAAADSLTEQY